MGCHTWFYRPIKENEIVKKFQSYCEYTDDIFEEDWQDAHIEEKYIDIDTPHNLFRIGGYPEDKLLSLKQTMEFIEKNKQLITFTENWEDNLKEFWSRNPDGIIEFG